MTEGLIAALVIGGFVVIVVAFLELCCVGALIRSGQLTRREEAERREVEA